MLHSIIQHHTTPYQHPTTPDSTMPCHTTPLHSTHRTNHAIGYAAETMLGTTGSLRRIRASASEALRHTTRVCRGINTHRYRTCVYMCASMHRCACTSHRGIMITYHNEPWHSTACHSLSCMASDEITSHHALYIHKCMKI